MALACGLPRVGVTHHPALRSPDVPRATCVTRGRLVNPSAFHSTVLRRLRPFAPMIGPNRGLPGISRRRLLGLGGTGAVAAASLAACARRAGHPGRRPAVHAHRQLQFDSSGRRPPPAGPRRRRHGQLPPPNAARKPAPIAGGGLPARTRLRPPHGLLDDLGAGEALHSIWTAAARPSRSPRWTAETRWWHPRADGSDTQSMLVKEFVPFLGEPGLRPWQDRPLRHLHGRLRCPPAGLPGPAARTPRRRGHEPGGLGPATTPTAGTPSTARRISRPMTCSRSGPGSRRCPSGSTAAQRTTLPPRFVQYRAGLPGDVEGGFRPGGHDTATGGPSCPRCCPSWAATSPEPAAPARTARAGKIVRC